MNSTSNAKTNDFASLLEQIADSIGLYAVPYSAGVALTFKVFLIVILTNQSLSNDFYKYLRVKTVFDILVNLVGIGFNNAMCLSCKHIAVNSYGMLIYFLYFVRPFIRILMMSSFLCDIFLAYNRTAIFFTKFKFKSISRVILSAICFGLSLATFIPVFFAIKLKPLDSGLWTNSLTSFGKSAIFSIYVNTILVLESLIPLAIIISLNAILKYKFGQYQQRRIELNVSKTQKNLSRIIVMTTTLTTIIRLLDISVSVLFRIIFFGSDAQRLSMVTLQSINLCRQAVYLLYFIIQSIDFFIYIGVDKNINKVYRRVSLFQNDDTFFLNFKNSLLSLKHLGFS